MWYIKSISVFTLTLLGLFLSPLSAAEADTNKQAIKIGVVIPLSGDNAFVGEDIRDGFLLAREMNKEAGHKYEFLFEDSFNDLHQAVLSAQKLISVEHVDVIVSLWKTADVVAPLAERTKTLHLSIRWDPDVAKKNHFTFTHETTFYSYAASTLKLLEKMGAKRVAILADKTQGWYLGIEELQRLAATSSVKLVSIQTFIPTERDFRTQIAKAAKEKPDIFLSWASVPQLDMVLRQLRDACPNAPVTGYLDYATANLIENQTYLAQAEGTPEFNALFEKKYGHKPKSRAPHAFDLFNLVAQAYSKFPAEQKPTSEQLVTELVKIKNYSGAVGNLSVDPAHFIESPAVVKKVVGGKRIIISPEQVQSLPTSH